jgi:hypothetical protein
VSVDDHNDQAKPVKFFVNRREIEIWQQYAAGSEIKEVAGIPEAFKLFGPAGDEIPNDKRVKLHDGERFTAISGQDVS